MRARRSFSIAITTWFVFAGVLTTGAQATPSTAVTDGKGSTPSQPLASVAATPTPPVSARPQRPAARPATANQGAASAAIGPEEHARRMQAALVGLRSADPVAIQDALTHLKELSGRAAADAIAARIQSGLPPQLTELSLSVLAELKQPIAVSVLSELTLHRRWQIRAKAVAALGALRVRSSVSVLLYALDDPSPEVRSAAARALGLAGDPRAIRALNAALERGVDGALEGLAHLATSQQLDALLARTKANLSASEPALWVLITRPNLPIVSKLKVIRFVQAHDSEQEAEQLLSLWKDKLTQSGELRLAAALSPSAPKTATQVKVMHVATGPSPAGASSTEGVKP